MSFFKRYQRSIKLSAAVAGTFFLLGFFYKYHLPKIERWLMVEIETASEKKSPIRIWPESLQIDFIPLGVTLKNVRLLPKPELAQVLAPTHVGEVTVHLSPFALLIGQLKISLFRVTDANFVVHIPEKLMSGATAKSDALKFDTIDALPLSAVQLENVSLDLKLASPNLSVRLNSLHLALENRFRSLRADVKASGLEVQKSGDPAIYKADIGANFLLDEEGIYFSELKISRDKSFVSAAGSAEGNILAGQIKRVRAELRADTNLSRATLILKEILAIQGVPEMTGQLRLDSEIDFKPPKSLKAKFSLATQGFNINDFTIGALSLNGRADDNKLKLESSSIKDKFGKVEVAEAEVNLADENKTFRLNLSSDNFDLQELFHALNLRRIPVFANLKAKLPCQGRLQPPLSITCDGELSGENVRVLTSIEHEDHKEIVALKNIRARGSVTATSTNVSYKAHLALGSGAPINGKPVPISEGDTNGVITYSEGFKINYTSPALNFKNVENLAGLKLEGTTSITGVTEGNSHMATIDLAGKGDGIWMYDFGVGKPQFHMRYRAGSLYFDEFTGQLNRSRYHGNLEINLAEDKINATADAPFLDASDLQELFSRKVELPFEMTGTGAAAIQLSGPLEFSRLSYDLTSNIFRGSIADETFDQLTFNVTSRDGHVKTRNVNLVKNKGTISMVGKIEPTGIMDLTATSRGLQIDQSETLAKLKLNMSGNLAFETHLSGPILAPKIDLQGALTQMTVGEEPTADSSFHFIRNEQELVAEGQFLGDRIGVSFHRLRTDSNLKFKIDNWNFAQAFSIFSDNTRTGGYNTSLTAQGDFNFPNQNWRLFSGRLQIDDLKLQNGRTEMHSNKPMALYAKNGIMQTQNFEMSGSGSSFVRLRSGTAASERLNLALEGQIDMTLLSLVTPFLEDLRGRSRFSFLLSGPVDNPSLSGTTDVEDGLIKVKGFPHPLEQMNADISFAERKIVLNSLKARLAGGVLLASGNVLARDVADVPVDIRGNFKDSRFNVPDGFQTRGSGDFYVKGNWFPYTIGVNYLVDSGKIESKPESTTKSAPEVKPSTFLPKFLSAQRFSPVLLALDINLPKEIPVRMLVSRIDVRASVTGQLKVNGNPDSPTLDGHISVARGGKVIFRSNTFEISSANVDYNKSPPTNPLLDVAAAAKVTGIMKNNETRDYDVDLTVQGQAQDPKITLNSDPPLAQPDLISLLTLGFINENQDDPNQNRINTTDPNSQFANTGAQYGGALISESLGINRQLEDKLGVQFDVSSTYDSIDQTTKPTVSLRKQWTPKFGTSASREIGKTNVNDVSAEYKLNKSVSVIGEWEGREGGSSDTSTQVEPNDNVFGLDLQYKLEFK